MVNGQVSIDHPPVLNPIGSKTVNEEALLTFTISASLGTTIIGVQSTLTNAGTFSMVLTGLTPNTTYYFRADATSNGTDYGAIQTFTTAQSGSF